MASKPKPALAEWLIAHRKERGETVEDIARVTDRSAATVRGWEAGRPPQADDPVIAHLERHFGSVAPQESAGTGDLAAAIRELTTELREARQERESFEARLRAVEAELESLRGPRAGAGLPERSVPLVTTG